MRKKKNNNTKKKRLVLLLALGIIVIVVTAFASNKLIVNSESVYEPNVTSNYQPEESKTVEDSTQDVVIPESVPEQDPIPKPETAKWPVIYTMSQASSLTVVVNKKHKLPSDYIPTLVSVAGGNMRKDAASALEQLLSAASSAGVPMNIISSYRSYATQVSTYDKWVQQSGQAQADTYSARPGHSEHQTGLAVDLGNGTCNLEICFGDTETGKWLASNAYKYGYIVRYPEGKQAETGYQYEPWHIRYLGVDTATAVKNSGQTLDQYYGVEAGSY